MGENQERCDSGENLCRSHSRFSITRWSNICQTTHSIKMYRSGEIKSQVAFGQICITTRICASFTRNTCANIHTIVNNNVPEPFDFYTRILRSSMLASLTI